jgi:membrane associated rhomboid family serine protease
MARLWGSNFFAIPHFFLLLLLIANVAQFLLCVRAGGIAVIPSDVLVTKGALTSWTLERGENWRLLAAGFLHADPSHLILNMISLVILGPHVERRLGPGYFLLIYLASLAGASVASVMLHQGPFVGVGASGAIYGLFAALFALWIMGETDLPLSFFVINFALNASFSATHRNLDWAAHFGGFATGFAACTILVDLVEKRNALRLRCKFPETVQLNALALIAAGLAWLALAPPFFAAGLDVRIRLMIGLGVGYLFLRLLDLLLSIRKGLAVCGLLLACLNAGVVLLMLQLSALGVSFCADIDGFEALREDLCLHYDVASIAVAALALLLTLAVDLNELSRGLGDKGFVAQGFIAERRRRCD